MNIKEILPQVMEAMAGKSSDFTHSRRSLPRHILQDQKGMMRETAIGNKSYDHEKPVTLTVSELSPDATVGRYRQDEKCQVPHLKPGSAPTYLLAGDRQTSPYLAEPALSDQKHARYSPEHAESIEDIWGSLLEAIEFKHMRLIGIKEGMALVCVDSPAWLYYSKIKQAKILECFQKKIPWLQGIHFQIGKA